MIQQIPEYVSLASNLFSLLRTVAAHPRTVALRRRFSRARALETTLPAGTFPDAALQILRHLPVGAIAQYEAPDGSRLTVWWTPPRPEDAAQDSGLGEYRLW
ncbi:hypothetical protein [Streptomyces sp. SAS_276]|uniref:hypothetical protein n=1 Tax=Streptomyces sp. SAS_276 TaxID=3412745 RepID=UPI00403D5135